MSEETYMSINRSTYGALRCGLCHSEVGISGKCENCQRTQGEAFKNQEIKDKTFAQEQEIREREEFYRQVSLIAFKSFEFPISYWAKLKTKDVNEVADKIWAASKEWGEKI